MPDSDAQVVDVPDHKAQAFNPGPALGRVLDVGSKASIVVLGGGLLYALTQAEHGGAGLRPDAFVTALEHGHATGVLGIGIALLIATPIARDATALGLFARHNDKRFAAMTSIVLALLALSVFIGSR